MLKYKSIILITLLFTVLSSCSNEEQGESNMQAISGQQPASGSDLKANALDENDRWGRVNSTLVTLQQEFNKSANMATELGKVTVYLDEHFTMMLRNQIGEDVIDTKINLKNLNPENGGMSLLPDLAPGEYPGLQIHVIKGKTGVEIIKNGKPESTENSLKIYMATRENIEKITPAMVQALNIVHGKY